MLLTWLQSSLSSSILSCVLGSIHAFQVWQKIHDHFQKLTRAKAHQLCTKLRSTTLDNKSVSEFLLHIKALADALASIRDPIIPEQHVDVILKGLPSDYNSVISVIESKFELMQIEEVRTGALAALGSQTPEHLIMSLQIRITSANSALLKVQTKFSLVMDKVCTFLPLDPLIFSHLSNLMSLCRCIICFMFPQSPKI